MWGSASSATTRNPAADARAACEVEPIKTTSGVAVDQNGEADLRYDRPTWPWTSVCLEAAGALGGGAGLRREMGFDDAYPYHTGCRPLGTLDILAVQRAVVEAARVAAATTAAASVAGTSGTRSVAATSADGEADEATSGDAEGGESALSAFSMLETLAQGGRPASQSGRGRCASDWAGTAAVAAGLHSPPPPPPPPPPAALAGGPRRPRPRACTTPTHSTLRFSPPTRRRRWWTRKRRQLTSNPP